MARAFSKVIMLGFRFSSVMAASSVLEDVGKSCKLSWVVDVYYSSYKETERQQKHLGNWLQIRFADKLDLQIN